jgi:hypothetical protein
MSYAAIILVALLFVSPTAFLVTKAHAQSCIDLIGLKWSRSYIAVYIASGTNDVQRKQVLFALQVWLAAQNWFIDSFAQGAGTPWLLYLTDRADEGAISVSFFIGQGVSFGGRAISEGTGEEFTRARVQINLPPDRAGDPDDLYVESVILHELGHAMGLGHTEIEADAMNGVIDTSPRNYGLPSTLDLYALYKLSQVQGVGELGGTVCLQSDVGYGLPPWVEQKPDGTVILRITVPGFGLNIEAPFKYPSSIDRGGSSEVTTTFRNNDRYPYAVTSDTARPDFGSAVRPNEQLPLVVEPNSEHILTHTIVVPHGVSIGTHTVTMHIEVVPLTLEGWSSEAASADQSFSFEVTEPQVFIGTGYTATVGVNPASSPTSATSPIPSSGEGFPWWWIIFIAFWVVLLAIITRTRPKGRAPQRMTSPPTVFCIECGMENPTTNEYCGRCGKRLVAKSIHSSRTG